MDQAIFLRGFSIHFLNIAIPYGSLEYSARKIIAAKTIRLFLVFTLRDGYWALSGFLCAPWLFQFKKKSVQVCTISVLIRTKLPLPTSPNTTVYLNINTNLKQNHDNSLKNWRPCHCLKIARRS
ncbi:hypothetical protein DN752_09735 [Echinicola strongylocentroti]|uniref:Uncharacterized protein n=1 Tax=Echinicola strongylocentroti TaxID=1795355 RepID=A0A2Z4IIN0_9BACT|nr:hypothetical protein DN752_09735 [Echinicola strongylocentroti]